MAWLMVAASGTGSGGSSMFCWASTTSSTEVMPADASSGSDSSNRRTRVKSAAMIANQYPRPVAHQSLRQ